MLLQFIHWNPNPEIFSLDPLSIRWYGLLFATGFICGFYILKVIFKKEQVPQTVLEKLMTYLFISTVIGARLGHCLFYDPQYYLGNPIEILKIWEGGLASHGAAIGIIVALIIFAHRTSMPFLWYLDRIVIGGALAGFFIRFGNLMNSEIIGKVTDLPWGFYFLASHNYRIAEVPRHPTQIYEALAYLLIAVFLFIYYFKRFPKFKDGQLFGMFLILVFLFRIFIEFFKEPQVGFENDLILNMGQSLSIPFVLAGVFLLIYIRYKHKKQKAPLQ